MDFSFWPFKKQLPNSQVSPIQILTSILSLPPALYFHGGNFTVGSKELLSKNYIERLLELGFVVISANYRLCPTTTLYDGPVSDTRDTYTWAQNTLPGLLKTDAGIDADGTKIVVLGHSCGGALALLTVSGILYQNNPASTHTQADGGNTR